MGFIADRGPVCQLWPWDERTPATRWFGSFLINEVF